MSDEKFKEDELQFLRMVDNFYSTYSLVKVCAKKCDILKPSKSPGLSSNETECLKSCTSNIELLRGRFFNRVAEVFKLNIGGGEGASEGGDE